MGDGAVYLVYLLQDAGKGKAEIGILSPAIIICQASRILPPLFLAIAVISVSISDKARNLQFSRRCF